MSDCISFGVKIRCLPCPLLNLICEDYMGKHAPWAAHFWIQMLLQLPSLAFMEATQIISIILAANDFQAANSY